jgi:hypothetical protein
MAEQPEKDEEDLEPGNGRRVQALAAMVANVERRKHRKKLAAQPPEGQQGSLI